MWKVGALTPTIQGSTVYFIYLHMIYDIYKPHTSMTSLGVLISLLPQ